MRNVLNWNVGFFLIVFVFSIIYVASYIISEVDAAITGNTQNLNFAISDFAPWIQTYGFDIRVDSGFKNPMPATADNLCGGGAFASGTGGSFITPGIIFSGDKNADFGHGRASVDNLIVGSMSYPEVFKSVKPLKTSTRNLLTAAARAGITPADIGDCSRGCSLPAVRGFYHTKYDMRIDRVTNFNAGNYIFVSDGTITIAGNNEKINVSTDAIVIFSAGKDIVVDSSIGATAVCPVPAGQLQGIFSADRNIIIEGNNGICAVGADNMLNVEGALIANAARLGGRIRNKRDLCGGNLTMPVITIKARPDFILNAPGFMSQQNNTSYEETP